MCTAAIGGLTESARSATMVGMRRGFIQKSGPLAVAIALSSAPGAGADTFKVNTGADLPPNKCSQQDCSLREAVIAANKNDGKDTIVLRSNRLHALDVAGIDENKAKTGDLDVRDETTIKASGKKMATIQANGIDRVLHALAPLTVSRLEITGGSINQPNGTGFGIYAPDHRLKVTRSLITQNGSSANNSNVGGLYMGAGGTVKRTKITDNEVSSSTGGAIVLGTPERKAIVDRTKIAGNTAGSQSGGLAASSNSIVRRSTIKNNEAAQCGGAELFFMELKDSRVVGNRTVPAGMLTFGGGGVCLNSGATMVGSTVEGNSSVADGGGVEVFGGEAIINSTIHDNLASDEGGGVSVLFSDPFEIERSTFTENVAGTDGGGLRAGSARVIVKSSTFQGNEGVLGGGIVANDQPTGSDDSVVDLRWSTISQNNSGSGGGIGGADGGSFLSEGTVIDGNMGLVATQTDCNAVVVSSGHNFVGNPNGCMGFNQGTDVLGNPALLGPIADNGGPTLTMKPKGSSQAVDAGGDGCPSFDQRLKPRPKGAACDIGSVEAR
ncbi:MAG: hypothetical protein QOI31_3064 [Solirubrobacterales bacterium]|jgi:CSLREA domain-containing protein|nr:hypothetical protein [Solirubrobacterales bacterium]